MVDKQQVQSGTLALVEDVRTSIDRIPQLPNVPEKLRLAARRGSLVPFVGAGVSQLAGCPGWNAFANGALKFFVEQGKLTHAQYDQMSRLQSRIKLSLALDLERRHNKPIDFRVLLKSSDGKRPMGERAYDSLAKIGSTIVTTNYDEWLDNPLTEKRGLTSSDSSSDLPSLVRTSIYMSNEIDVRALDQKNTVIHIHGSVKDRDSMILTTTHYLDRYASHRIDGGNADGENRFLTFLEELFRLKSVLFVGYGLEELEILEYIVQKAGQVKAEKGEAESPSHFVVQGFFSHEIEVARSLEAYYRQFGVGLLPFSRDERDWEQLVHVIEHLAREIPAHPSLPLQIQQEMEELLQ
ncbi:MAG: SIR2 family protein [Proteobacteria bacterium]|nr:SIR2 family protein [Pseudomonadota bacterium]